MHLRMFSLSVVLLLLVLAGCNQSTDTSNVDASKPPTIIGRWEFVVRSGGIAGETVHADPARKEEIEFTSEGMKRYYLNGAFVRQVNYSVVHEKSAILRDTFDIVTTQDGTLPFLYRQLITTVDKDKLVLVDDFVDGYGCEYKRTH